MPEELDGCYVSGEFPTFLPIPDSVDVCFLTYWFRLPHVLRMVQADCTGSTPLTRNRYKEQFFLHHKVPLPPLHEQRRIVAKIERLMNNIHEVGTLRRAVASYQAQLQRAMLFGESAVCRDTPMSELVQLRQPDIDVVSQESYEFAGIYSFGRGMFRGQTRQGIETSYKRLTRLQSHDFVYPKLMAWEGAFAIVPAEYEGLVVSTEFPVFTVNTDCVLPEVLETHFSDPTVWAKVSGQSTGTNVRRRRLHPEDLLRYQFPLPPRQIQAKFRQVKARLVEASRIQAQVDVGLDAPLPRILDQAFKGML